jgi:hypothetical protein
MTSSRKIPKEGTCGGRYELYGNNPAPLGAAGERCCDTCNWMLVIPVRLRRLANDRSRREGVQ